MKRAFRERAMRRLYADLESANFDVREFALFQIALVLRRSGRALPSADWTDHGGDQLKRELLRIRLTSADQERIAAGIALLMARCPDSRASAFWALGELDETVGIAAVVSAILDFGGELNDEAALQACLALQRWLETGEEAACDARELLDDPNLLKMLIRWSRSTEVRLAKRALDVIELAQRPSE